jgi:hypothetical protein
MLIALALGLIVVGGVVFLHYEALHLVAVTMPKVHIHHRPKMLMVIAAAIAAHMVEIVIFALLYYVLEYWFGLGTLEGDTDGHLWDFIYFSSTCYTTLGFGDIYPVGPLRTIAALESLLGLVLITWSASYTYITMREFW